MASVLTEIFFDVFHCIIPFLRFSTHCILLFFVISISFFIHQFPWKPKPLSELLGDSLVGPNGQGEVSGKDLKDKTLALYFSASW